MKSKTKVKDRNSDEEIEDEEDDMAVDSRHN